MVTVVVVTRCSGHGGKEDKVVRRSRWGQVTAGGVDGVDGGSGGVVEVVGDVRQRRGWLLCVVVVRRLLARDGRGGVDGSEMVGRRDGSHGDGKEGVVESGGRRLLEEEANDGGW
ncbi:hypothetical protein Tco_1296620 [Tanacetum coccineum]